MTAERQKILTKLRDRDHELREQRKLSAVCRASPVHTPGPRGRPLKGWLLTGNCRTSKTK